MAELIPDEVTDESPQPPLTGTAGVLDKLVTWWGLAGGLVFCAIVLMSIVSIVGRKLFATPIDGDMELLMMGAAIGSAAFLPLCEMHDHHIKVDALTTWMNVRARSTLDALAHCLLMLASAVICWRSVLYTMEAHENTEVSTLLLIPLWQPLTVLVPSFALLTLAALYRLSVSIKIASGVTK
jgi:TRAP-type C4-dicarboxylate transport system permease small subunit